VEWIKEHRILTVIGVIVILAIAGGASGGNKTNDSATNSKSTANTSRTAETTKTEAKPQESSIPAEYKSALAKAEQYSDTAHMSKQGIYDQLVSDYGEKFKPEAAQYAVDNLKCQRSCQSKRLPKDSQYVASRNP
jgi:hypothetical protein